MDSVEFFHTMATEKPSGQRDGAYGWVWKIKHNGRVMLTQGTYGSFDEALTSLRKRFPGFFRPYPAEMAGAQHPDYQPKQEEH